MGNSPSPTSLLDPSRSQLPRLDSQPKHPPASGQNYIVLGAALAVATAVTDVEVGLSRTEVAAEQIKVEEKQRGLGVLPNFYVS